MIYGEKILIFTDAEKPKNCDIVIKDFTGMCEISINEKQFELLNEKDKVNVFLYLQELEEKIEKMEKMSIIVKKQFND